MSELLKGLKKLSFHELNHIQKRSVILSWTAANLKFRLKDYDIKENKNIPTTRSASLSIGGREGRLNQNGEITHEIPNQLGRLYNLENNKEDKVSNEIIDFALQVLFNMFEDIEASNSPKKKKYLTAVDNKDFLRILLQITIILTSQKLLEDGYNIDHVTLQSRLTALKEEKNNFTKIWKDYSNEKIDLEEAVCLSEKIFERFENQILTLSGAQHNAIGDEKALYSLVDKDEIQNYIFGITAEIRNRFIIQKKLDFSI
ncbi:MAG: hypothetical protein ACRCSK_07855 [Fusobacteriaceae bacterium]